MASNSLPAKEVDALTEAAATLLKDAFAEVLRVDRKRFESVLGRLEQSPGVAQKLHGLSAQVSANAGEFYR